MCIRDSWYIVAPVALVAALPRNRLTTPILVFSGSSLIVLHYHPVLLNWTVQTALRYGLPLWAFLRGSRRVIRLPEASDAAPEPIPATAAPAPAAVGD